MKNVEQGIILVYYLKNLFAVVRSWT